MISDFGLSKMEDSGIMATACGENSWCLCSTYHLSILLLSFRNARLRSSWGASPATLWQVGGCVEHWCDRIHFALWISTFLRWKRCQPVCSDFERWFRVRQSILGRDIGLCQRFHQTFDLRFVFANVCAVTWTDAILLQWMLTNDSHAKMPLTTLGSLGTLPVKLIFTVPSVSSWRRTLPKQSGK